MNEEGITNRIRLFFSEKVYTHIKLTSGTFLNGHITFVNKDTLQFNEDFLGSIPVIIDEIEEIDYCTKRKEVNTNGRKE